VRLVLWSGEDEWRAEAARVDVSDRGLRATGTQLGLDPLAYRLDYELDATDDFKTRSLVVHVAGEGWSRQLSLSHDGTGSWDCEARRAGEVDLPAPGGDPAALEGALDCDLGLSPLTNAMPVLRHGLHRGEAGKAGKDFLMAWVSVPDLAVHAYPQRYEHVRDGVVRFIDRGLDPGFVSELELDADGLVVVYPHLARRVNQP
jgi:uncharacterized protein